MIDLHGEDYSLSIRQLREDISFMESTDGWSIDLERITSGRQRYYRYSDTTFSIQNQRINDLEIRQIQEAVQILNQFEGMPQFDWMQDVMPKLQNGIQSEQNITPVISFESNEYLAGKEFIAPIFNAIRYKKVLLVQYQGFKQEGSSDVVFHPYFLKQYNNRWFAFGLNEELKMGEWNMPLDRIVSIEQVNKNYLPTKTDWQDYFSDIVGVTHPKNGFSVDVHLLFSKQRAPYVQTKPFHSSQKSSVNDNGELLVRIKVVPNLELVSLILSFGSDVTVIQPKSLIDEVRDSIKRQLENYENV